MPFLKDYSVEVYNYAYIKYPDYSISLKQSLKNVVN